MLLNVCANSKDSDQSANLSSLAKTFVLCRRFIRVHTLREQTAEKSIRLAGLSL